jgi:hypothetical protein
MVKGTVAMPFNMKGYYHEGLFINLALERFEPDLPFKRKLVRQRGRYGDQGDFLILILILWISFEVPKLG